MLQCKFERLEKYSQISMGCIVTPDFVWCVAAVSEKIPYRDVDTAYISPYVGIVNLNGGAPVGGTLEVKMVLFGLVFLTMTIIATLYFT